MNREGGKYEGRTSPMYNGIKITSLVAIALMLLSIPTYATVVTLTSGTSWTVPTGVNSLIVTVIASGGNGQPPGIQCGGTCSGGGGGSATNTFTVTPYQSMNYALGTTNGLTWFGGSSATPLVAATGGQNGSVYGQSGGAGTVGAITKLGGNGYYAGGGGAAGATGAGQDSQGGVVPGLGGSGTPSGGNGGYGTLSGNAYNGNFPGGGGGSSTSGSGSGGLGAGGEIYITYTSYNSALISASGNTGNQYETSSQPFSYVVSVNSVFTTANMVLQVYNGVSTINTLWNNQTVNSIGYNYFNFNYLVPLLASNNIAYTFNAVLYLTGPANTVGVVNTIKQTELENYFVNAIVSNPVNPANVLIGSNVTVNTIINQAFALNAITAAGYVSIGNKHVSEYTVSKYGYLANVSFIPSDYGLTMPTLGSPITVSANSVLQLTFNGNSVYRNVTGLTFKVYNESLVPCGGLYTTNTITWAFYNVTNIMHWPANVFAIGHFIPTLNTYLGATQPVSGIGFGTSATANVYNTCIYPSWGKFNITGVFQYNATGSLRSTYYANLLPVSNVLTIQRLYLEAQPAPISYEIYAQNQQTAAYIGATVYVYSYYIGNDTSILLDQITTPPFSGAAITLEAGNQYTFTVYSPSGQFLGMQGPLTASQCSSSPCPYVIYTNIYNITNPGQVFGDIAIHCSNSTTGTNQITQSCTYVSKSGTSYNIQLYGYLNGIVLGSPICLNQQTASSGTLSCTFQNTSTNLYFWQLKLNQTGAYQLLNNGYVGMETNLYGSDAVWFAMLIIITLAFLFLTRSIVISVILFDAGWTVTNLIGIIQAPGYTVPMLWILSAVLLYLLNRK